LSTLEVLGKLIAHSAPDAPRLNPVQFLFGDAQNVSAVVGPSVLPSTKKREKGPVVWAGLRSSLATVVMPQELAAFCL